MCRLDSYQDAYTLLELALVVVIVMMLVMAGVGAMKGVQSHEHKVTRNQVVEMLDRARVHALVRQVPVCVAIADPKDHRGDQQCRLGLFEVPTWCGDLDELLMASQFEPWLNMAEGLIMGSTHGGGGLNPRDCDQVVLQEPDRHAMHVHAVVFGVHGGVLYPQGNEGIVLEIVNGRYRRDGSSTWQRSQSSSHQISVGRLTGRSHFVRP